VRLSAKADYALRACVELATRGENHAKAEAVARAQSIPLRFLEQILLDLKHAGIVASQRGAEGGYWLARAPAEIPLADVIRAVEGPLANVRGVRPEELDYPGPARALRDVFVALRANIRAVLEEVTLADVAADELPDPVRDLIRDPEAWSPH
jgi:Rrf2 family protein